MTIEYTLLGSIAAGIFAVAGAVVGQAKGRVVPGVLLGLFLGPLGVIIACTLSEDVRAAPQAYVPNPSPAVSAGRVEAGAASDLDEQARRTREGMIAAMQAKKRRD